MKSDAILKIISKTPGEPFRSNTVVNTIQAYNDFVGGICDIIEKNGYLVVFDMQGQYHGRKPNAKIDGTMIYGDMFIARSTKFGDFGDMPLSDPSVSADVENLFEEVY